ncbi:MAG: efflux RND transporter periplasmic adaptor subunit [Armatimonadota bacterium]|nr:efflux RND transporter periplasmic adaptor subunit [Armatimonadota bacterium]
MRWKPVGYALLFLLVAGLVFAAHRAGVATRGASTKAPEFATVKRGRVVQRITETGTIAAGLQVEVKSKVAGKITHLLVDEGDPVQAGQLLARVDPTEVERQANQAAAEVLAGEARVRQAEIAARQQREQTRLAVAQAEARLAAALANLQRLVRGSRPQEIARAEAAVVRAQAEAEEARAALERALTLEKRGATAREDAQAALAAARAELARLEAGARPQEVAGAEAVVEQARAAAADAARTLARRRELFQQGFVSRQEVDSAQSAAERADAALEEARQRLSLLREGTRPEDLAAARARVRQAEVAASAAASTAEQTVSAARARVAAAEAALASAREDLELLRAGPRMEEIELARAQVREARAALESARAGAARDAIAEADVIAARAELQRIRERQKMALVQLADTRITAPISGTVIARHLRAGELVASGVTGLSAGVPVVTIADLSRLLVRVRLNEVDVARVRLGQQAEVRVDAYPGVVFTGQVRRVAPSAGERRTQQPSAETQIVRFDVEVELSRPDPRLRSGMTASVDLILDRRENTLYVLQEALVREGEAWVAYVVSDPDKVRALKGEERTKLNPRRIATRKVTVKTGLRDDLRVEVLSGLKENDLILVQEGGRVQRRRLDISERS